MPTNILPQTFVSGFHDEESVKRMEYREVPHLGCVYLLQISCIILA